MSTTLCSQKSTCFVGYCTLFRPGSPRQTTPQFSQTGLVWLFVIRWNINGIVNTIFIIIPLKLNMQTVLAGVKIHWTPKPSFRVRTANIRSQTNLHLAEETHLGSQTLWLYSHNNTNCTSMGIAQWKWLYVRYFFTLSSEILRLHKIKYDW